MEDAPKTEPQYNRWDLILGYCKENSYKIMQTVPERIVLMLFREAAGVRRVTIRFEEPRTFLTVNISPLEKIPSQSLSEGTHFSIIFIIIINTDSRITTVFTHTTENPSRHSFLHMLCSPSFIFLMKAPFSIPDRE